MCRLAKKKKQPWDSKTISYVVRSGGDTKITTSPRTKSISILRFDVCRGFASQGGKRGKRGKRQESRKGGWGSKRNVDREGT